jgi:hypothetical protein
MTDDKREAMFVGAAQHLPSRRVGQPEDIANAVLFLATRSFATGLNAPPASALWKMSLAANHRISLDLDLGVRNRQRSNGD